MNKLDRILNHEDLATTLSVDEIDKIIQRRRFARSGRSHNQDEPVGTPGQFIEFCGQAEVITRGDDITAESEAHFGNAVATVKGDAYSSGSRMLDGDAKFPVLLELE